MATNSIVKLGKSYAPDLNLGLDWGLRYYLAVLRAGDTSTINTAHDGCVNYANRLSGPTGVTTQVDNIVKGSMTNSVQSNFQPWTGDAATAYHGHSQRVTTYGHTLGESIGGKGPNSLISALAIAGAALTTAQAKVKNIEPTTWPEANAALDGERQRFQDENDAALREFPYFWSDTQTAAAELQAKGGPDVYRMGQSFYTSIYPRETPLLNKWFGLVFDKAGEINKERAGVVCAQLNTVAAEYVRAYQALPAIPTAPSTKNPANPKFPPAPTNPTIPTNPAHPSPTNTPTPPGPATNSPTNPMSTTGMNGPNASMGPTSTAGLADPNALTGPSMPDGSTTGYPSTPSFGAATPAFNPNTGHLTSAAGLGAVPPLGGPGLGGAAGARNPKGLKAGAGQFEGSPGAGGLGALSPEEAAQLGAANAAAGRGGMPAGSGAGGGKGNTKERNRGVYLPEDEDVWGVGDGTAPPVISGV